MCSLFSFASSVFRLPLFFTPKIWLITIYCKTKVSLLESFWQAVSNYAFLTAWNHWYLSFWSSISVFHSLSFLFQYSPKKHLWRFFWIQFIFPHMSVFREENALIIQEYFCLYINEWFIVGSLNTLFIGIWFMH